jgi:hypothetical protein
MTFSSKANAKNLVPKQSPPVILLEGSPVTFKKKEDGIYDALVSGCPKEFPGLNSQYYLGCFDWNDEGFSDRTSWYVTTPKCGWNIPARRFGSSPTDSLRKILTLAENVSQGKAGTSESVSGATIILSTSTNFDFSPPTKYWTGASIDKHFFGTHVAALKGRRYKKNENRTEIKSMAMLDDLEASLGIGRHCAIELLSEGKLARGTLQFVQEGYGGFMIHLHLYYADGKRISRRTGTFILNQNFKIAKRHLDGRWLEVFPK